MTRALAQPLRKETRLSTETNPFNKTHTHTYDAVGNRIGTTDRNNRDRTFTYDNLNRQVTETWFDEQDTLIRTTSMTYDAANQLTRITDPDSTYAFDYDALGRHTQVSNEGTPDAPTVVLDYGYDADGNVTSVSGHHRRYGGRHRQLHLHCRKPSRAHHPKWRRHR
ncbi:hypothetical protein PN498_01115 [Oscillatoria sp. CS-180]|uniref:RHS repeat protein n=1 Tax=Oscillatoria sp. CS-180 TaxID=3021720 RepID=UPI00232BEC35|nr:RHS repeat protein [Oscillatoria sp. CS-180]MDB9524573.1 hypothetical protein [Oscillatoria sp. CS-180]